MTKNTYESRLPQLMIWQRWLLLVDDLGSTAAIMPTKEEKEVVDAFASVFTVIDAGTFSVRRTS